MHATGKTVTSLEMFGQVDIDPCNLTGYCCLYYEVDFFLLILKIKQDVAVHLG